MYKLMITLSTTGDTPYTFEEDFDSESEAWDFWDSESDIWETTAVWVEHQNIIDEFGIESAENVMNTADDYLLDNGTHL